MEINLKDHLDDDMLRAIAEDEFRKLVRQQCKDDFERILSNAGYALVHREVDAAFDDGMAATVRDKAIEVINGISAGHVFRAPDAWNREPSKGWEHLQAAMAEAKPAIVSRVHAIIAGIDENRLLELIEHTIADAIVAKLTAKP